MNYIEQFMKDNGIEVGEDRLKKYIFNVKE